ncbi:ABC transporter permease subunit [Benzoatithermus flavus]|uniref:Branched-chain amino acid ABC transporter permease n=1 Tax=Benzoatithermus flavus TaxID=3108223 RepID=A0ABU8Y0R7_9PROT
MDGLALLASVLYQLGTNAAFLLLCALGLIVILGMMNIINLAHGELMMMGAYTATMAVQRGIPFPLAVLLAFVVVGLFGAVLERLIVRRFYGRELGALVVTWGLSLILAQGTLILLGPFMPAIQIPGGSVSLGQYSFSVYWLVMIAVAAAVVVLLWWLYNRTTFGLEARATMQNAAMARALGVDTERIYMLTFSLGAGLAGLSGALLAPTTSIAPFMGQQFVAPAFITVVVGGATNVIAGAVGSSLLLSLVRTPVGFLFGAFLGLVALLFAALVIIRLMPDGISAYLQRWHDRRTRLA